MIVLKIQHYAELQGIENANQFAVRTGLPSGRAWKIWNQHDVPTLPTLNQLCAAFGCTLDDLVSYVDGDDSIRWAKKGDPLLAKGKAKGRLVRVNGARAGSSKPARSNRSGPKRRPGRPA